MPCERAEQDDARSDHVERALGGRCLGKSMNMGGLGGTNGRDHPHVVVVAVGGDDQAEDLQRIGQFLENVVGHAPERQTGHVGEAQLEHQGRERELPAVASQVAKLFQREQNATRRGAVQIGPRGHLADRLRRGLRAETADDLERAGHGADERSAAAAAIGSIEDVIVGQAEWISEPSTPPVKLPVSSPQ